MTSDSASTSSYCSTNATTSNPAVSNDSSKNLLSEPQDDWATCRVMADTPVSKSAAEEKGLYRDYEGNRYWFCCAGCAPKFDANPAKYATQLV